QNGEETFFHPNKTDKAEIDYVLFNRLGEDIVKGVAIEEENALNTSDHRPVYAEISIDVKAKTGAEATVIQIKPKWESCDKRVYQQSIRQNLQKFDTFLPSLTSEIDILQPLAHLNAVLKRATYDSIPNYKPDLKIKNQRRRCWSQKIQAAMKNCRLVWWEWRKAGESRNPEDPAYQKMNTAKKMLRKEQRLEAAKQRNAKIEDIMSAGNNPKTFFKLINNQRKSSNVQLHTLVVDGQVCETDKEIREGWANHFQKLATPLQSDKFDDEYKELVDADVDAISILCEAEDRPITQIKIEEVQAALKRLNNNKAADVMGLTSEHFKLGGGSLSEFLMAYLNYLVSAKRVSAVLKEGILTPIFKKGDTSDPGNYRGITVTPVLLKILEHILNARHNDIFYSTQSLLQRGFTQGCSSLNAAVILTECVLEAGSNRQELFLTTLDTQKAFDVVDHSSLLRRLYLDGVHGDDWLLIRDLYSDCSSRIKWAGGLSHPININQGVRQGGVLSTSHYKRYNNPMLLQLEERYDGVKIGSISVPHVTVADDLALLAQDQEEMQVMVWDVENNASRERYFVNPSKSHALRYSSRRNRSTDIYMYNQKIKNSESTTHLGIVRDVSGKPDIEAKISLGRKTAYSLMGAGFHGGGGVD
ncbi:MAG: reverse transcriptase family protein, partial [Candidatus Thiodiazotropha sp.]